MPNTLAVEVLEWAAGRDLGHHAFLQLGGKRLIYDALEQAVRTPLRYGEKLHEMIGLEAAGDYLRFVLETAASGLRDGHSHMPIADRIRAELFNHFRSAEQRLRAEGGRHAAIIVRLAHGLREAVRVGGDGLAGNAERAKKLESEADEIVRATRATAQRIAGTRLNSSRHASRNCRLDVIPPSSGEAKTAPVRTITYAQVGGHAVSIGAARRSASRASRLRWVPAAALLTPSLTFLVVFTYGPVLRVLGQSFIVGRFTDPQALGLSNYGRLFADPHFARAAWNNAVYAAGTIVPSLILGLLFALALRETTRWTALMRTLLVMPLMIPLVAAAALFSFIFLPGGGLIDFYLGRFGFAMTNWLGDPDLALGSIIAITVWKNTGYYMLFFLAGLAAVPQELLDAARIDGAGALRRLRHVTVPMLGPTFGFVVPIAIVNALTQVDHVVTMTQGGPSDATNLLLYYIYQQMAQNYDLGLAAAATVVSVAALLSLSLISFRALERGVYYES